MQLAFLMCCMFWRSVQASIFNLLNCWPLHNSAVLRFIYLLLPSSSLHCLQTVLLWASFTHLLAHMWLYFSTTEIWQQNYRLSGYEHLLLNLSIESPWQAPKVISWFSGTTSKSPASYLISPHWTSPPRGPLSLSIHVRKATSSLPSRSPSPGMHTYILPVAQTLKP